MLYVCTFVQPQETVWMKHLYLCYLVPIDVVILVFDKIKTFNKNINIKKQRNHVIDAYLSKNFSKLKQTFFLVE